MSSTGSDIGPGVRLTLKLPSGAREEPEGALPSIEVAAFPGASLTLRRGYEGEGGVVLRAACVRAPSDRWAPGIEELVLGRATGIARSAAPADLDRWDAAEIQAVGSRFEQRLSGEGRSQGRPVKAIGRHMLGFAGESRDAVLCSLVCVEPASAEPSACSELVLAATPEGAFTEAPPPSALVRLVLLTAARPREAGIVFALTAALVVLVVLARRPRPRP
jgi:hypothetical protein